MAKIKIFIASRLENENIEICLQNALKKGALEKVFEYITPYKINNIMKIEKVLGKYDLEEISKNKTEEDFGEEINE